MSMSRNLSRLISAWLPWGFLLGTGLSLGAGPMAGCARHREPTGRADAGGAVVAPPRLPEQASSPPSPAASEVPDPALADLLADDLQLRAATYVNPTVVRLELERHGRPWRAKWKAMGAGGSEEQEGLDGNNSPRCEVAAYRLSRLLAGPAGAPLVPPVVVRALHRDVPCDRSCRGLPRLVAAATPATFPELNDHLVLGAMALWIEGARTPQRLHGELWSRERFAANPEYRRSVSDLFLFLYLIAHGDANYGPNFLLRSADLGRVYSIDNGRAFDGVPYYVGEGEPDWQPLAELAPDRLIAPAFAAATVAAVDELSAARLQEELALVAAVDLASGRTVRELRRDPELLALPGRASGQPLESLPGLRKRSRQTYTGVVAGKPFVLLGIGPQGIAQTAARARQAVTYLRRPGGLLFSD